MKFHRGISFQQKIQYVTYKFFFFSFWLIEIDTLNVRCFSFSLYNCIILHSWRANSKNTSLCHLSFFSLSSFCTFLQLTLGFWGTIFSSRTWLTRTRATSFPCFVKFQKQDLVLKLGLYTRGIVAFPSLIQLTPLTELKTQVALVEHRVDHLL